MTFHQHSLFKKKHTVATAEDLIVSKLEKHGDKIIVDIPVKSIHIKPQVRRAFDEKKIARLAFDIATNGLIHPITVMKHPAKQNMYTLLIGENRILAIKHLQKKTIPCIVKDYSDNPAHNELLQLAENLQRQDLNPIELANAIMRIKQCSNYTLKQIAAILGRTVDSVKQYSRISKLSDKEKNDHIAKKSTKNDILTYLAKKELSPKKKPFQRHTALFSSSTNNAYASLSKEELLDKIYEAESFLKVAKKLLKS